jgi:UDP-N-acetylmuramate dehydrogenase
MNAGSSDEWIGEIVDRVTVLSPTRGLVEYGASEVRWDYRRSDLQQRGIIIESVLRLEPGDANRIRRVMEASLSRRKRSQPVGRPSAGSVFRNPEGDSAGRLIEAVGLKGTAVGNAVISDVHANFIVNAGGATARDVLSLIGLARRRVEEVYGIRLQPEIKFLGSFPES